MTWKLWLDDERNPPDDSWEIARDFHQAVDLVTRYGFPIHVAFDHDLGWGSPSGFDFAKWLIDFDMDTGDMPEMFSFSIQSANPIGAENIRSIIKNYLNVREWE